MKAYLLAFGGTSVSRDDMARILDECEEVSDWRSDLPFCFYLHSESRAPALSECIKHQVGGDVRVFISEIGENSDGFITKESWYFILDSDSEKTFGEVTGASSAERSLSRSP